jgi:hypothetical protein
VPEIERYVSTLFAGIPVLQHVFDKLLCREVNTRRFAALSILFGIDGGTGLATALDVVSCGTASLTPSTP